MPCIDDGIVRPEIVFRMFGSPCLADVLNPASGIRRHELKDELIALFKHHSSRSANAPQHMTVAVSMSMKRMLSLEQSTPILVPFES